jgi:CheY-like chemotaxis protein
MMFPKPRVLLVDDAPSTRVLLGDILRRRGYEVEESHDGLDALERVWTSPPDVILTDLVLPGRNGFDLVSELKADARTREIPVLVVTSITGTVGMSDDYWRRKSNADDFLSKPFEVPELVSRMELLLLRSRQNANR